jgi:hypothetical protein
VSRLSNINALCIEEELDGYTMMTITVDDLVNNHKRDTTLKELSIYFNRNMHTRQIWC